MAFSAWDGFSNSSAALPLLSPAGLSASRLPAYYKIALTDFKQGQIQPDNLAINAKNLPQMSLVHILGQPRYHHNLVPFFLLFIVAPINVNVHTAPIPLSRA